jgi:hypothetical protein
MATLKPRYLANRSAKSDVQGIKQQKLIAPVSSVCSIELSSVTVLSSFRLRRPLSGARNVDGSTVKARRDPARHGDVKRDCPGWGIDGQQLVVGMPSHVGVQGCWRSR